MEKKKSVLTNMAWRFAERVGAQGVKLIVELVLARLLMPDDYGVIALVAIFITILNVFVDSGLGSALIQKLDADDLDFSTVFWFNLVWCTFLYGILFLIAPLVAAFYARPLITPVLRVLGVQLIISGVKNVEQAYVSRNMQFRKFFFATLGGTIGAAAVGIAMALYGLGVWALVGQQLFNVLVDTIILWFTVKWRPKKMFSLTRLKSLFSFGWKLLVSVLIDTVYNEVWQLIIGKRYSSSDLAFYNRGQQFPYLFVSNVNSAIDSVLLPTMSKEQEHKDRVKMMVKRSIQVSIYIMAPLLMGLAFAGEPLVKLLLTDKWLPCVPFMRIFCITYMFYPIHTANLNALKAMGRSDLFLKLEILKKVVGVAALLVTMWYGIMPMAYSLLFISVASQIINCWPNRRLLGYGYLEQMKDILPSVGLAVFMGVCIYCISFIGLSTILTLLIQVILGIIIYLGGSKLLKLESYYYVIGLVKGLRNKSE